MSEIHFTLPRNESALGLLGLNNFSIEDDGCVFAEDGYIYKGGVRLRKYFSHMKGFEHFWKPVLSDLSRLEFLHHKLYKRGKARWAKVQGIIERIVQEVPVSQKYGQSVWKVHAKPYTDNFPGKIWLYTISKSEGVLGYSWDWVDEPTENKKSQKEISFSESDPIRMDLGNELCECDHFCQGTFRWKVANVLNEGFKKFLESKKDPNSFSGFGDYKFEVQVNDRVYLYQLVHNEFGVKEYEKLSWPGDNYQVFKV